MLCWAKELSVKINKSETITKIFFIRNNYIKHKKSQEGGFQSRESVITDFCPLYWTLAKVKGLIRIVKIIEFFYLFMVIIEVTWIKT